MSDQHLVKMDGAGSLKRQFKQIGTDPIDSTPVFAEVVALEAGSIGGGAGGGLTDAELRAAAIETTITGAVDVTGSAVSVNNFPLTQAISAASLPLPTGAATDAVLQAVRDRLPAALVGGRLSVDVGNTPTIANTGFNVNNWPATQAVTGTFWQATQPVSGPLTDAQLRAAAVPVSGTFWQATQPISGTVGVSNAFALDATLTNATQKTQISNSAGTAALVQSDADGINATQASLAVQAKLMGLGNVAGTWQRIRVKELPTGAEGLAAIPVWPNGIQYLTYDVGARGIVTGALVAGTAKAVMSFEHPGTATKTVKIRRIAVHMIQTTALSGAVDIQITRGTAASTAGTAITPVARRTGDSAAEVTVKTLPTIVAATVADNIPAGGFATTTTLYSPPVLVYDWQEAGETKPYILKPGTLESIVINVVSTAAHNLTLTVSIDFTEE